MIRIVRDALTILRSGIFMHSAYARHYLGSRRRLPLPLLHFLWKGERLGYRANPFIDPVLKDASGARVSIARYCRDRSLWMLPPSRDFDPAFYRDSAMAGQLSMHPFIHFWRFGLAAGHAPAPDFDLAFFDGAVAVFRPDKVEFAYECALGQQSAFPRNERELVARQKAFQADVAFEVRKDEPAGHNLLVFVQASHDFEVPYDRETRTFDLLLNIYDREQPPADTMATADVVVAQTGTKTTAIRTLLERAPDLITRYEAVLFLDDDVEIAGEDITRLFTIARSHGLDLVQPALTADSACAFSILKQPEAGHGVRPISVVEIMMPLISRRALLACGDVFAESVSGWGVDALLSQRVRARFGETIALAADVVAAHRRDIDLEGGAFYRYLARYGIEPHHELGSIALRYGIGTRPEAVAFVQAE